MFTTANGSGGAEQPDRKGQSESENDRNRWGTAGTRTNVWCVLARSWACWLGEHALEERLGRWVREDVNLI